ncbi:MAG: fibronectin type III domain-containing protein [Thaumarchaeota archaeon]|nr:fibronectin type III domain-containing protein [Nitrososphaerota archaeon]
MPKVPQARPYFKVDGNATASPGGLNTTQVWNAYGFSKLHCLMTGPSDWNFVNLCGYGQTVAIVGAYDDPTVGSDLATFDAQWGLPACTEADGCLSKAAPQGVPAASSTWALEDSLAVEWVHATAPGARIVLVESRSADLSDIMGAVGYAENGTGAGAVSMGWGLAEFPNETMYDNYFSRAGTVFFAASGGSGASYPAASPGVVSVGGTTLYTGTSGMERGETAWAGGGGWHSLYENEPDYQMTYDIQGSDRRAVPDVSYDADPATGFAVYDSTPYLNQTGWFRVGGTGAGAAQWASIAAISDGEGAKLSSDRDLASSELYTAATGTLYASNFRDIVTGTSGKNPATEGYDLATGLGSPQVWGLVSFLSPKPTVPSAPAGLEVNASDRSVTLKWQPPSFGGGLPVTRYSVYRGSSSGGEMFLISMPPANQTYTDPDLENGVSYYYYITAANAKGESVASNEVYGTPDTRPSAPEGLAATLTDGTVYLTWSPPPSSNGSPLDKYTLFRGTESGLEVPLKSVSGRSLSCTDSPSGGHRSYYYYVTATNGAGQSIPSNEASVTEPPTAPSAPQDLEASGVPQGIKLSWKVPGDDGGSPVAKYDIYAGMSSGEEIFLSSVPYNVQNYTNYYLVNGVTYYYYVTAVNSVGQSEGSDEVHLSPGR